MYVLVTPNIKGYQARNAKHVIYAHKNEKGHVYIGQSGCMVNRWNEHLQIAKSKSHPEYGQKFKKSLRESKRWEHYVIGIAETASIANDVESAAIVFYKPALNSIPGTSSNTENLYDFQPLDRNGREIKLEGKTIDRYRKQERYSDKERKTIKCRAINKSGKSHVSFECIDDGMRVNISHDKRIGFCAGDTVKISFAAKGKTFYTTTEYSQVQKVL